MLRMFISGFSSRRPGIGVDREKERSPELSDDIDSLSVGGVRPVLANSMKKKRGRLNRYPSQSLGQVPKTFVIHVFVKGGQIELFAENKSGRSRPGFRKQNITHSHWVDLFSVVDGDIL